MMRILLGATSLLLVVAVVAWLARSQLHAASTARVTAADGTTATQPSLQLQQQVREDLERALQRAPRDPDDAR